MSWTAPFVAQWDERWDGPWVIARQDGERVQLLRESGEFHDTYAWTGSPWRVFATREEADVRLRAIESEVSA